MTFSISNLKILRQLRYKVQVQAFYQICLAKIPISSSQEEEEVQSDFQEASSTLETAIATASSTP